MSTRAVSFAFIKKFIFIFVFLFKTVIKKNQIKFNKFETKNVFKIKSLTMKKLSHIFMIVKLFTLQTKYKKNVYIKTNKNNMYIHTVGVKSKHTIYNKILCIKKCHKKSKSCI